MKLEQSFEVQAPIERVWEALIDLERVAPCLPGAAITDRDEDGTYHGTFQVKLGPTTAAYRGTIQIEDADAATHTATLKAKGTDKRGQGSATAAIVNHLVDAGGATRVDAVTDLSITGRLAQFGRSGMIEDVSNRLLRDFASCLQSRLAAEPAAPAAQTGAEAAAVAAPPEQPPVRPRGHTGPTPPSPSTTAAAPPPAGRPIKGLSLFFSVLWERIRRLFSRDSRAYRS